MSTTTFNPPERYVSINEACRIFGFSRTTFYRMLADPASGLGRVVVRIPPRSGRVRIPLRTFEAWLKRRG